MQPLATDRHPSDRQTHYYNNTGQNSGAYVNTGQDTHIESCHEEVESGLEEILGSTLGCQPKQSVQSVLSN
jgi:hypothetical protein